MTGKSGGFPCRHGSCDERFFVAAPGAMKDLQDASALRVAHEAAAHEYVHKSWEVAPVRPFSAGPAQRKRLPRERIES